MRAFLFIAVCLSLVSCFDKGDCLFASTNVVKVSFFDINARTTAKEVPFDSLFIPGKGYFLGTDTVSAVNLIVDPRLTSEEYVFQYGGVSDTLVLTYTNQVIVLSPDCGSYNYQNDLAIGSSTFEEGRVVIVNQRLLNTVTSNVEIYF